MSDFHQGGAITTLHRLGPTNLDVLERDLEKTAATRPVALVLPCLASEFDTGAIPHIIEDLQQVRDLEEIVVALGRASGKWVAAAPKTFRQGEEGQAVEAFARANVAAVDRDNT